MISGEPHLWRKTIHKALLFLVHIISFNPLPVLSDKISDNKESFLNGAQRSQGHSSSKRQNGNVNFSLHCVPLFFPAHAAIVDSSLDRVANLASYSAVLLLFDMGHWMMLCSLD